jgi:calcineurin-like phosphoesterase
MKILYLGDVMGRSGRQAISNELPSLRARLKADFVVVNGENATGGMGLSGKHAEGDPKGRGRLHYAWRSCL